MKLVIYTVLLKLVWSAFRGPQTIEPESITHEKSDYTLQYLNTELAEINLAAEKALEVNFTQREKLLSTKEQEIKQNEKLITTQLGEYDKKLHDRETEVIKKEVWIEVTNIQNEKFRLEELKTIQQEDYREKLRELKDKEGYIEKDRAEAKDLHEKIIQNQYKLAEYEGQLNRRNIELDEKERYLKDLQNSLNVQQGKLEQKEEEISAKVKTEIEQEKTRLDIIQQKQKELDKYREEIIKQWHSVIQDMELQQTQVRNKEELNAIENIEQKLSLGLEELEASRTIAESFLNSVDLNSKSLEEKLREFQLPS